MAILLPNPFPDHPEADWGAIGRFARWLGFLRAGKNIEDTARPLINGLIRDGRLEAEGRSIRRT